jgi:hypothetical protein
LDVAVLKNRAITDPTPPGVAQVVLTFLLGCWESAWKLIWWPFMLGLTAAIALLNGAACVVPGLWSPSTTKIWSSMFDELVMGVPAVLTLGASDEDRDELLGARDDERDEDVLWPKG